MKTYETYKESGVEWIGKIPKDWKPVRLRYLCDITTGDKDTVNQTDDGIYPFYVRSKDVKRIGTYSFDGEAILTAGDGDICKIWHYVNEKFDFHQRVYMLYNFKNVDGKFLYYFISENFIHDVLKLSAKSTVDSLRLPMFLNFPLSIPEDIKEQTQIANYLDHKTQIIDALIEKKEQLIQKLQAQRQAIINEAVTKGLNPNTKMKDSGIEWLGDIPEHWEVVKFRHKFKTTKGLTITKANLLEKGIPCVNYGEIHSKFGFEVNPSIHDLKCVSEDYLETNKGSLLRKGDFIFADTSEDIEGSGNFTYLNSDIPTFAGYHTIIARLNESAHKRFFAYFLDSAVYRVQVQNAVKGVKVYSITNKILKDTVLFFPPISEQILISEFLDRKTDTISNSVEKLKSSIKKLKSYRQSIISEAVTGKIDVRDWQVPKA
ncbi:restriction endonuclease subunit S [Arenibacter sp. 6A1]|uniref:restriction endonuclease subunit S n=1 Tax=Arenibacter sp. 6A1 TaxID=2720391 RepID=UPI001447E91E|nr:restriction endonuclease subunit S [Arenibacter sp. 6A1]NKI28447.1 restriction endonuclease subunit S [Arenibacter sp. 6A1]